MRKTFANHFFVLGCNFSVFISRNSSRHLLNTLIRSWLNKHYINFLNWTTFCLGPWILFAIWIACLLVCIHHRNQYQYSLLFTRLVIIILNALAPSWNGLACVASYSFACHVVHIRYRYISLNSWVFLKNGRRTCFVWMMTHTVRSWDVFVRT